MFYNMILTQSGSILFIIHYMFSRVNIVSSETTCGYFSRNQYKNTVLYNNIYIIEQSLASFVCTFALVGLSRYVYHKWKF